MRKAWWSIITILLITAILLFGFRLPGVWPVSIVLMIMLTMSAAAELIAGARDGSC